MKHSPSGPCLDCFGHNTRIANLWVCWVCLVCCTDTYWEHMSTFYLCWRAVINLQCFICPEHQTNWVCLNKNSIIRLAFYGWMHLDLVCRVCLCVFVFLELFLVKKCSTLTQQVLCLAMLWAQIIQEGRHPKWLDSKQRWNRRAKNNTTNMFDLCLIVFLHSQFFLSFYLASYFLAQFDVYLHSYCEVY